MNKGAARGLRWMRFLAFVLLTTGCLHAQRMVFAHYMLANRDYTSRDATTEAGIAGYERDIQEAQAIGIDGFALNAGGWFDQPRYIRRAAEMFEAATRLHNNFKLMFSADMCCGNRAADVEDMMRRFANNPRYANVYFKHRGRFVLTTFSGSHEGPEFWQQLRNDLEHGLHPSLRTVPDTLAIVSGPPSNTPLPIEFVPAFFFGGELPPAAKIQDGIDAYGDILDGLFYWGIAGVPGLGRPPDQIPSSEAYADALHKSGKIYMAPICFQFWGANAGRYYEYSGYAGMRALWRNAIRITHPDWVEIITWNDFVEGTYVSPIDDPAYYARANDLGTALSQSTNYFHTHRGATELLRYYIAWYKSGHQPTIQNDSVFWAYRSQMLSNGQSKSLKIRIYGPVANVVYVTANLTAPAILEMSIGKTRRTIMLQAGSSDAQLPMIAGPAPHFRLLRNKEILAEADAADPIAEGSLVPNFYNSTGWMHSTLPGISPHSEYRHNGTAGERIHVTTSH